MQNLKVGSTLQGGRYKKTDKETISENDDTVIKETENKKKEEKTAELSLLIAALVKVSLFVSLISFDSCSVSGGDKSDTLSVKEDSAEIAIYTDDKTFSVGDVEFVMKHVEGGTFTMGATSEQQNPEPDENPTHQVTLSSYYIGETEVTQVLWTAVMWNNPSGFGPDIMMWPDVIGDNHSGFEGDNNPVECVSWNDCQRFISKLNSLTGQNFRLPTEAEWEYAARGGKKSKGYQYSGSNNIGDVAWYSGNSGNTHPVKTKQPNELGIYDMSGNVWEWCQDRYGSYSTGSQTNPKGPSSGSHRVFRGGSWINGARYCRAANRDDRTPDGRDNFLGLRLALSE